jgi:hypothetical protein
VSFQAVTWAITQRTGSPGAKSILWSIANYANENGVCWPSQSLIAQESEQSADTVQRKLPVLVELGLVRRVPLRFQGRKSVDFFVLANSPWFGESLEKLEPLLPRGHVIDPDFSESEKAEGGPAATQDDADTASDATAYCGNAAATLPQTLPQPDGNAAALVRQHEPVTEPSEPSERESARARGEASRRFAREFRKRWPTAALDDQAKLTKALEDLPEDQRQACLDGIQPFLDQLRQHKRGHCPAGWKYIEERRWTLIDVPAGSSASSTFAAVKCWSREWWGVLLKRIAAGDRTTFMVQMALDSRDREAAFKASDMPSDGQLEALQSIASDSVAMQAWRPWFDRHGVRFPQWSGRFWVFLPAAAPPTSSNAWDASNNNAAA